jgi:hypothetical protein
VKSKQMRWCNKLIKFKYQIWESALQALEKLPNSLIFCP